MISVIATMHFSPSTLFHLLSVFFYLSCVSAIPIDNAVENQPEIECGATALTVNFNTRKTFQGRVYVKGLHNNSECRTNSSNRLVAGIQISIDSCNVERLRSLNPKGVYVTTIIVISFHPKFITKIDRAYRVQCFYMEADKTAGTQIDVSQITTEFQTQDIPMPECRYEILEKNPTGKPVRYAMVGDQVYHKWTCDSPKMDIFCAIVHSCVVDDGQGNTVQILNEDGCALDKYLLNNLEYPTDLMAGQEAHVYKYADRSELHYQCQISITIKEPDTDCPRPQCPEPQGFGAIKSASVPAPEASALSPRTIRLIKKRSVNYDNTMDVSSSFSVIDISEEDPILPADHLSRHPSRETVHQSIIPLYNQPGGTFCITPHNILLITLLGAAILVVACVLFIIFIINSNNNSKL